MHQKFFLNVFLVNCDLISILKMNFYRFTFQQNPKDFKLIPLFDIHFGSVLHNNILWNKVVKLILEKNCYCYIGGDILEFVNVDHKHFCYKNLPPDFQTNLDRILSYSVEYAIEKLQPIKDKILFIHAGNHDVRFLDRIGFDPITAIAKELDIKYYTNSYEVLCKFIFKNKRTYTFDLYSHHGVGISTKAGSLINRLEDILSSFDADIYIMGHSHQLIFTYKNFLFLNNTGTQLLKRKKYMLRVGGFRDSRTKNFADYSEKLGHKPSTIGTFLIEVENISGKYGLKFRITPILD